MKLAYIVKYKSCSMKQKGFTLIELMIIVALLGVLSAIAIPQINKMLPTIKVNAAMRQVMSKMLLLKMKAVAENGSYGIIFTAGGSQYQVKQGSTIIETENLSDGIIFGTNSTKNTSGNALSSSCISNGYCIAGGSDTITFTSTGTATTGTVYLITSDDKTIGGTTRMRAIGTNNTGRIKAWRYTGVSPDYWENY